MWRDVTPDEVQSQSYDSASCIRERHCTTVDSLVTLIKCIRSVLDLECQGMPAEHVTAKIRDYLSERREQS